MKNKISQLITLLTVISIISLTASRFLILGDFLVEAAGVSISVSDPSDSSFAAGVSQDVTFGYTSSSTEFESGDTITVTIDPALASAVSDCTSATTDADGDTTSDGSFGSFGTNGATYTFSAATTTATSGGIDLCLNFADTTTAGNYSISVSDTNDNDYGSALVYVGDDNDVTVTASVAPTLAFNIRNSADDSDTNSCDLGTLSLTTVESCSYRLKVTTNSTSGYTININSNGDLSKNGTGDVADVDDIDPIANGGTTASGTENYGVSFTGGDATGGTVTESGNWATDETPVPTISESLLSSDGPNAPSTSGDTTNTALLTHNAAMDGETAAGNYSQIVTYTVTPNF